MFNIERNEQCWCGSGKKYKACHLRKDEEMLQPFQNQGYPLPNRNLILTPKQIEGIEKSSKLTKSIIDEAEKIIKEGKGGIEMMHAKEVLRRDRLNAIKKKEWRYN